MKQIMNKKMLSLLLLLVFLAAPFGNSYGFLSRDERQSTAKRQSTVNKGSRIESRSASSASGWLRATVPGDEGFDNGAGTENNETTTNDSKAPVGSGLWILLPLALGYGALSFRQNRIKIKN